MIVPMLYPMIPIRISLLRRLGPQLLHELGPQPLPELGPQPLHKLGPQLLHEQSARKEPPPTLRKLKESLKESEIH